MAEGSPSLLLVADTAAPEALGSKLLAAARQLGLDPPVAYSSPAPHWSPSMRRRRGKVFYRLADRRSWEWWGFQRQLLALVEATAPRLVLVTGILPLQTAVFSAVQARGGRVVNLLTDDPWNPIHRRRCFLANLRHYDHIFSTKEALGARLEAAGCPSTSWLPFAHHPPLHRPPQPVTAADRGRWGCDLVFVGTGAGERLPWLAAAAAAAGGAADCRLHGNDWRGLATPGWRQGAEVLGDDYCRAIYHARVVLGLLRQANGDTCTDRSFEIGAIGGCGLYQDSPVHRALLPGYPDVGFFRDPAELERHTRVLLGDGALRQRLRELGAQSLRQHRHSYTARLEAILAWADSLPR